MHASTFQLTWPGAQKGIYSNPECGDAPVGPEAPEELKKTGDKGRQSKTAMKLGAAWLGPACLNQLRGGRRRVQRTVDLEP